MGGGTCSSQFENNYFTEMCSGSEAGSYLRLIDFVYHSTIGFRVIKKDLLGGVALALVGDVLRKCLNYATTWFPSLCKGKCVQQQVTSPWRRNAPYIF